jgi:hypothetical protein
MYRQTSTLALHRIIPLGAYWLEFDRPPVGDSQTRTPTARYTSAQRNICETHSCLWHSQQYRILEYPIRYSYNLSLLFCTNSPVMSSASESSIGIGKGEVHRRQNALEL